jgi:O-antigen/teichoic acid export membrane protein
MNGLNSNLKIGMAWSLTENLSKHIVHFIIGIILARLLSPSDYGLIGLCAVLLALGTTFVDGGFSGALIRKNNCSEEDYSTVFYFNLFVSIVFYALLFFTAPYVSKFFGQPQLSGIIRILGIVIVIGSLNVIQRTILTKEINFKLQTKITITSITVSGSIGIIMAFLGYGVWSLVIQALSGALLSVSLMWRYSKWRPKLIFSKKSFGNLFAFGSNLLITDLINTLYSNIYYIVIGKVYTPTNLGFFTRAETTVSLVTSNITNTVKRVSYPALAILQDEDVELKILYRKLVKNTMLISCSLVFGLAAVAESLIVILIGHKWLPSAEYIQLLCLAGVFMPLTIFNLNSINVKGHSKLYMHLQLTNKLMVIPVVLAGVFMGLRPMLIGFVIVAVIYYLINVHFSSKLIYYTISEQLKDILPIFLVSGSVSGLMFVISFIGLGYWITFLLQVTAGIMITTVLYNVIKLPEFMNLQGKVLSFLRKSLL